MHRRALLSALASASVIGLGGCLGENATRIGRDGETQQSSSTRPQSRKPVRCRGEPISAERTVTDEPGYEDDMKYFPSNETIRYVAMMNSDGPAGYETISFEEWGSIECTEAGLEKVREVMADRLDSDEFGSAMGTPPGFFSSDELVITLEIATRVKDEETVTPALSLSKLADVAPKSVDATVSLDGKEYSRTVPVFAEHIKVGLA